MHPSLILDLNLKPEVKRVKNDSNGNDITAFWEGNMWEIVLMITIMIKIRISGV